MVTQGLALKLAGGMVSHAVLQTPLSQEELLFVAAAGEGSIIPEELPPEALVAVEMVTQVTTETARQVLQTPGVVAVDREKVALEGLAVLVASTFFSTYKGKYYDVY